MKQAAIAILVLAAVGGAYFLGTLSKTTTPAATAPAPEPAPPIVDNLIVPTGLTIPTNAPTLKIDEPAKVLAGEVKIPVDLLRKEPPANPNFVIPELSR